MSKNKKPLSQFHQSPQTDSQQLAAQNKADPEIKTVPANESQTLTDQRNMPKGAKRPGGQSSK